MGSRHIRAHRSEQGDDGDLPHVGALAAHVGAGDDLHTSLDIEICVIGHKGFVHRLSQAHFHYRMAATCDLNARLLRELWGAPVECERAFGQGAQRIQGGNGSRGLRECVHEGLQLIEHLFIQQLLPCQRPLLR